MKIIWIGLPILIVVILIIFYLSYRNKKRKAQPAKEQSRSKNHLNNIIPHSLVKKNKKHVQQLVKEHEHKRKEREREELFHLFSFGELKGRSYVDLLDQISKHHEFKKRIEAKERKAGRKASKKLKKLLKKLEVRERKAKEFSETEAKNIFEELKKVIEKK